MADLQPTNRPGVFVIPALGATVTISEWTEQDIFDVWALPTTAVLGTDVSQISFFTNVQGKTTLDTNMTRNSQTPARHSVIVLRPGLFVLPAWGTAVPDMADANAVYSGGTYEMKRSKKIIVPETHLWGLGSGYGIVAYGVDKAAPSAEVAPLSLGMASPAAQPHLLVPFQIQPEDDYEALLRFPNSNAGLALPGIAAPTYAGFALNNDIAIMAILHGFMKAPGTR